MIDTVPSDPLYIRLLVASQLAQHIRTKLEEETGYTATVGISTNKLLAKLVGNQHKPNAQTTLLPPYLDEDATGYDNVTKFLDDHDIGKLPGIGFKMAQKLRFMVLGREAGFTSGVVYGGTKEHVLVRDVRCYPGMSLKALENILRGPGAPNDIGGRVWGLLHGSDETQVSKARDVPRQISIEDSYLRLDTLNKVTQELSKLATSLLKRMHTDLLEDEDDVGADDGAASTSVGSSRRWLAYPRTIRLSTRPRPLENPDGSRDRSFTRISRSAPLPTFALSLKANMATLVEKLVNETLLPLFRKLHPERKGWNLSLVNVAVTNMADGASEMGGVGRDIGKMFRRQDHVLRQWKVEEAAPTPVPREEPADAIDVQQHTWGSEDVPTWSQSQGEHLGPSDSLAPDDDGASAAAAATCTCERCGALFPIFAWGSHVRWHSQTDGGTCG
ncbi:hypothetical protein NX059_008258 [Plenodomus lindquistii]|nr:hypothetical protein NX059_008258 [Plenodomus lindquistii]